MYSINDVDLNNPDRGWVVLRKGTQAVSGVTKALTKVNVPGYDGYFRAPSTRTEQILVFNMLSPLTELENLLALLTAPSLAVRRDDDPTREAYAELVSAIPSGEYPKDSMVTLTVTLSVYGAAWRDSVMNVYGPTVVSNPIQSVIVLPGLSAPVRDMDVFISGVFGQFTLLDSGGSWVKSTAAWPGSSTTGMLYVGATGQVFIANTSSPWVPVSDAGHLVDVSGGGGFKITPEIIGGDPSTRQGRLTLTTLTQTSTNITVRAKGAYSMQFGG